MYRTSVGGGAASCAVYRHMLVRIISDLLGPLAAGRGWSPAVVAIAGVLMSWDPAPTLAQRVESVLGKLDTALPRRRVALLTERLGRRQWRDPQPGCHYSPQLLLLIAYSFFAAQ